MRSLSGRLLLMALLHVIAVQYNRRRKLWKLLRHADGWFHFTVGFRTEDDAVGAGLAFADGRVKVQNRLPDAPDVTFVFRDPDAIGEMLTSAPNEVLNLLLRGRLRVEGNFTYLQTFSFFMSRALGRLQRRLETRRRERVHQERLDFAGATRPTQRSITERRGRLQGERADPGVKLLDEPYLTHLGLDDFPRLRRFRDAHFATRPELCDERARILTAHFRDRGFERDANDQLRVPVLRQAEALAHLMRSRQPIVRDGDLLAGTTTAREVGVVLYPDAHGTLIWGELDALPDRELNPYDVSAETLHTLHHQVFPFWTRRNFREWVRRRHHAPLCQTLDERFALYFVWKSVALSHTVPDFEKLLTKGTTGILAEVDAALAGAEPEQQNALQAMATCLHGLEDYADALSARAETESKQASDEGRRRELEQIAAICHHVPRNPARTLHEAVQSVWICWVGLHMENTNAGLSLGRLDQWLQPYLLADATGAETPEEREALVRRAVELVGCLFLRCADHLPLVPDIGNYLFGGSSSDQAITLGGVTPQGEDAVNDMTYILLKATELLALRDPNINARFDSARNSQTYLRRLCEVNLVTAATPSMHGDGAVRDSLVGFGWPAEHIADWSATGCVEPTLSGRHMGHTGAIMLNMVAALEMALHDGTHPLLDEQVGPPTGRFERGEIADFEAFFEAFSIQLAFLVEQATTYNNLLAEAHAELRPTPLLSALIDGCIESGTDVTSGGARYNTTGVACVGLADVTDSLLAVEQLVYTEERLRPVELMAALEADFVGHDRVAALLRSKVARFGSGSEAARRMAGRVAALAQQLCRARTNYRGGPYSAGFWSMSNHVAFGTLAGALPSGRRAGKAFTPGLTPQPGASDNLLDNLRDVATLDPASMSNNMAFNVKLVPAPSDTHEQVVDRMRAYVKTYFGLGGMQVQFNVVTAATLRDAMAHPEDYRDLLVRISGYNAYFVTLNPDMQRELVERAEYGL